MSNASSDPVNVSYEHESESTAGTGGTDFPPCVIDAVSLGQVAGTYSVSVDGEVMFEERVPTGVGEGAFLVVSVSIDPDGGPGFQRSFVAADAPDVASRAIPDCG